MPNNSFGFSLIEVLVAWFLLTITTLSLLAFQNEILHLAHQSYLRHLAMNQLENIFERLRANHSPAMRIRELQAWNSQNSELLPKGSGNFDCSNSFCTVNVHWLNKESKTITLH